VLTGGIISIVKIRYQKTSSEDTAEELYIVERTYVTVIAITLY
jgi:hypothetical protein